MGQISRLPIWLTIDKCILFPLLTLMVTCIIKQQTLMAADIGVKTEETTGTEHLELIQIGIMGLIICGIHQTVVPVLQHLAIHIEVTPRFLNLKT